MSTVHEHNVKHFFNTPTNYLRKSFGLRLRKDLFGKLLQEEKFNHVLDVGCGDGSISLPYIDRFNHLTLNDLSPEMLNLAVKNLSDSYPEKMRNRVSISNVAFQNAVFNTKFDLILMIGVLAHVKDINVCISKLHQLLHPHGSLIVQFSEYNHPLTRITHLFNSRGYDINRLSYHNVSSLFKDRFILTNEVKYLIPFPGMSLLDDNFLYSFQEYVANSKLLSSFGTDYILKFKKV